MSKDNKLRVYEYAKSLNMSSKEIITILKRLNLPVNNHMSVMENEMVSKVEGFFRDIKSNAAAKRAQESSAAVSAAAQPASKPTDRNVQQAATDNKNLTQDRQVLMNSNNTKTNTSTDQRSSQSQDNRPERQGGGQNRGPQGGTGGGQNRSPQGGTGGGQNRSSQGGTGGGQNRSSQGGTGGGQNRSSQGGTGGGYNRSSQGGTGGGYNRSSQGGTGGGQNRGPQGGAGGSQNRGPQGGAGGGQNRGPQGTSRAQFSQPSGGSQGRSFDSKPVAPARSGDDRFDRNRNGSGSSNSGGRKSNQNGPQKRFDDNRTGGNFRGNNRGGKGKGRGGQQQPPREKIDNTPKKIIVRGTMTVGDLAKLLHKDASEVIKKLISLGIMATINQEIEMEAILLIAAEYGSEVEVKIPVEEDDFEKDEEKDEEADLLPRPPVVTIMGHVDHGKTTLLDAIRKTNVTGGEAGGITQHIGAYQVEINQKKITFLDTPGHEAFTLMRARGAQVTDITIIVVAADDGVMPQTVEAVNHAKAAGVPIIVAVNKIDKPEANPDKIKQELTEYGLVPEEWGGDTIFVNVSAKQRIGLEGLLEMILLVAEVNDYKANPDKRARGTVIEAELDKGKGPVARILVQHGTLKIGDAFVAGNCFGRVRAMVNDRGRRIKEAGPSTPVEITGLTEVPQAGDPFMAFEDERKARAIAERRAIKHRQSELGANTRVTLDDLYKHIKDGEIKDLNVIIKADVQGSNEALKGSLAKIDIEGVRVKIIHNGVGAITESDIILASASNAIVIGFNVRPEPQAMATAEQEKVDIRLHNIIYNVIDEIEQAMKGMLDPVFKEVIIGHAEVRNIFKVSKVGAIAGCMITDGKVTRSAEARVIRGGIVVHEGKVDTLKRYKDDAKEVAQGYECGITLQSFTDFKEGDVIEAFVMESVER
ncbi:translation initiation factor IF-2 [Paenibacillus protaetiae]|uniref:Translation initiation factor IF-2 n=1 Tax=Paenibacillus protaetiae TaxID=2509456 RepID=A0A4P6F559_9BACL|nr:translation initiation factor IF-2 [Paenibacillus protaetiae]QAY68337.1 translation initiation factor IF-2 [Paenibacillus protaetiae]